ncbi:MAG: hypothetical protein IK025_06080 [Bacteroidales bacterium]|nr:hypothetical protein [Bacteroidales bacterium]
MFELYKNAWISEGPPHLNEKISKEECVELLGKGGYMVRNTYNFDTTVPTSFWYVIKDNFGEMNELSSKTRNQVKKSLKTYDVRMVTGDDVIVSGLRIFNSALKSYNKNASMVTQQQITEMIRRQSANKNVKYEYWMVFEKTTNIAVALAINTIKKDCCEYSSMKCDTDYMHNSTYPYYGLIYEMNRHYLQDMRLKYVCDGARSITEHSDIQPFLEKKFNFRKAYCCLQIEYKWWLGIIIKVMYPFRKIIPQKQIQSLLRMEAMRRNEY